MVVLVHSMSPMNEGHQVVEWGQHSHPPSRAVTTLTAVKMEPMIEAQGHVTALPAAGSEVTVISPGCKTLPRPTQAFQAACFLPHPAASMTLDIKH